MRYILFFLFSLSFCSLAEAQPVTFRGQIVDTKHLPLPYCHITQVENGKGIASNQFGYFVLREIETDSIQIEVSSIGFINWKGWISNKKRDFTIVLQNKVERLDDVQVKGTQNSTLQKINTKLVNNLPSVGGGAVESLIKTLPGVYSSNELSSQYNVRGGNFDENLIYVNGIEVYRPLLIKTGQQEGISFVNPQMVENIKFSAGGFDALYGDKMSSVLDINYKRPQETEGRVETSLLGASVHVGGAFGKTKAFTHSSSIRYKTTEYILNSLDDNGDYKPTNIDFQTFLSYKINEKWEASFFGNYSSNNYEFVPQTRETQFGTLYRPLSFTVYYDGREEDCFKTMLGAGQIAYKPTSKIETELTLSSWKNKETISYDIESQYLLNELEYDPTKQYPDSALNLGIGSQIEHARNSMNITVHSVAIKGSWKDKNRIDWGASYKSEKIKDKVSEWEMRDSADYSVPIDPELLTLHSSTKANNTLNTHRVEAYLQGKWNLSTTTWVQSLTTGVRFQYWSGNQQSIVSPRLSYQFFRSTRPNSKYRFSFGYYQQMPFYKELKRRDASLNIDEAKAQTSIHYAFAWDKQFQWMGRPFKLTTEGYYKQLKNLTPYQIDNLEIQYLPDSESKGYAGGVEFKLNGEFVPGIESWLSLSLMKTEEDIEGDTMPIYDTNGDIVGKKEVGYLPRPTDQRFMFSMFFQDYLPGNERLRMNLLFSFGSGKPFGPANGNRYQDQFRMPAYQRIDVGLHYDLIQSPKKNKFLKNATLGAEIFNLFNKSNTASYYWATTYDGEMYAVPNYLSTRRLNIKLSFEF